MGRRAQRQFPMLRTHSAANHAANSPSRSALPRTSNFGRILRCFADARLNGGTPLEASQKLYRAMPWIAQHFERAANPLLTTKANEVAGHHTTGAGGELDGARNAMA